MDNNKVLDANGREIDFSSAVNIMDDELREDLHAKIAPCEDQLFFEAYAEAHKVKFGEEFAPYAGLAW